MAISHNRAIFCVVGGKYFNALSFGQQSKINAKLSVPKLKAWSTFSKVVGLGSFI